MTAKTLIGKGRARSGIIHQRRFLPGALFKIVQRSAISEEVLRNLKAADMLGLPPVLRVIASLCVIAFAQPSRAEDDPPPVDCNNAMSTYEMNVCSDKDFQAADAKLNEAYKKALAKIAKSDGEKPYDAKSWEEALRASQRAWVAFRDADCKGLVPMAWGGGTGTTVQVLGCMISLTEARTKELNDNFEEQ